MAVRPFRQGRLDSMCGIYAVINATRIASLPILRLTADDCQDLFSQLVEELELAGRLLEVVTEGSTSGIIAKMLRSAATWLAGNFGTELVYRRPFKNGARPSKVHAFRRLATHLVEPRAVAIVALKGNPGHWTVARAVTHTGSLVLFDSGRRTLVSPVPSQNSKLELRLSHRDFFLIRSCAQK